MTHVAAFNFDGINVEELSVRAGELLNVSGPPSDGWVKCVSVASGKEGFVPESYIKEAPAPVAAAPRRAAPRAPGGGASVPPPAAIGAPGSAQVPPPAIGAGSGLPPLGKGMGEQRWSNPSTNSSSLTKRGGAEYEIVRTSIAYDQNLGEWRERERKFQKGELERLPEVKTREYYYWDRNGARHGPLTETEMKARFDNRQVGSDTLIAPMTTSTGSEALPKMSVNDYFPDSTQTFITAPIAPIESHTWLYLDDNGKVQGPFDAAQMREWFLDSYFNAETKAKLASRKDIGFVPLGVLFGPDGAEAFLHDGDQLAASQHPQSWPKPSGSSRALGGGLPPPVNTAVPAALTPDYFGMNPNPVDTAYFPPPAAGYGYTDPFGVQPPAAANPFASPARSPSSRGLGLTPKAQSGRMLLSLAINGTPPPPAAGSSKNPFEAPDYSTPAQTTTNDDDWGITWDDEKEEAGGASAKAASADLAVPVPISGGKEEDNRRLAPYDRIKQDYLSNSDALIRFLTHALPKELGTVRCKIKRSMNGMLHVNYNVYELYLEMDNGKLGPEILRGVKHKRMGFDSYFDIQVGQVSMSLAETVLATMVMTTLGTQFLLHDNVKSNRRRARDLACVHYLRTGSGGGPRKMTVAIPGFLKDSETDFVEWPHGGSIKKSNLVSAIESLNFKDIQPLMNKPPVWSEKRKAWTLNFHGRVTRASVKNFQLVRPEDHDHIVLQHGRVGQDTFTMDVAWPLSPVQAFAVCISSLHGKLGVE